MNEKGWGLPEMIILAAIIIMALIVASLNIKKLSNGLENSNKSSNKEIKQEETSSTSSNENQNEETNNNINNNLNTNDTTQNSNTTIYLNIESKMVEAATKYIENDYKIENNTTIIVDKAHLSQQDESLLQNMSTYNCTGYVIVTNDNINNYFTPYLKCDLYTTNGYNDSYE